MDRSERPRRGPPRRVFLIRTAGAATAAVTGAAVAADEPAAPRGTAPRTDVPRVDLPRTDAQAPWGFFNAEEAAFVAAAVARLIPADELGPGAQEAGVPAYIDRQLAGAWGAGDRLYRSGPWPAGTPSQGYQLPFTPAELFRTALGALSRRDAAAGEPPFSRRPPPQQDAYLQRLQAGDGDLEGVPASVFFESLWAMTLEGFFGDPVHGGNRDMVGWRLIGFPGAHANYYHLVDRHGESFAGPPVSLADFGHAHGAGSVNGQGGSPGSHRGSGGHG